MANKKEEIINNEEEVKTAVEETAVSSNEKVEEVKPEEVKKEEKTEEVKEEEKADEEEKTEEKENKEETKKLLGWLVRQSSSLALGWLKVLTQPLDTHLTSPPPTKPSFCGAP